MMADMSVRSLLMPALTQRLFSLELLERLRARAERRRVARGDPHRVHYFHQVDDPYSALAAGALAARYRIEIVAHLVSAGLAFRDPGAQLSAAACGQDRLWAIEQALFGGNP